MDLIEGYSILIIMYSIIVLVCGYLHCFVSYREKPGTAASSHTEISPPSSSSSIASTTSVATSVTSLRNPNSTAAPPA